MKHFKVAEGEGMVSTGLQESRELLLTDRGNVIWHYQGIVH